MVMLRIGDQLISEQVFIGITLVTSRGDNGDSYLFEASWDRCGDVCAQVVLSNLFPTGADISSEELDDMFKKAYNAIAWDNY